MQNAEKWAEALANLKHILDQLPLEKTTKWGADVYTYQGKNVVSYGGFKHFFTLWFYNGVFLSDPLNVLITASGGTTKSLRQWRFTDVHQINESDVVAYVLEAIEIEKQGLKVKPQKATPQPIPNLLKEAFTKHPKLKSCFEKLSVSKQNEYILYISEAKQEVTQIKRLDKIIPLIQAGVGLQDQYKK